MNQLSAKELEELIKNEFGDAIEKTKRDEVITGKEKNKHFDLWLRTSKEKIKNIISFLKEIQFPHFTTMFGDDKGEKIELNYVLTLFYESELEEVTIILGTEISKQEGEIDSITDLIPGAVTTEREMQEMLGINIRDLPDDRHIYLPFDQPEEEYPWRRDEKASEIEDLYEKEGQQ